MPAPTPRYSETERQKAHDDLTTALSSYDYLTKNSDPVYAQNALDRAKKIAEEHGFKLEEFDGGIRIAAGTPGFPADPGIKIPNKLETPVSQPGKSDGRYATPAHSTDLRDGTYAGQTQDQAGEWGTTMPEQQGDWQDSVYLSENNNGSAKVGTLGERGVQTASKTLWKGDGKERLDVENPNPGQRPGQLHYQDNSGNKYLYDPETKSFPDAPRSVNKLLNDPKFKSAIDKGMEKYLGE